MGKDAFCSKCGEELYQNEKHICEPEYAIHGQDVAGFDLCGWLLRDGTIELASGSVIARWPSEVELLGNTYTLEEIKGDQEDNQGRIFQNVMYV